MSYWTFWSLVLIPPYPIWTFPTFCDIYLDVNIMNNDNLIKEILVLWDFVGYSTFYDMVASLLKKCADIYCLLLKFTRSGYRYKGCKSKFLYFCWTLHEILTQIVQKGEGTILLLYRKLPIAPEPKVRLTLNLAVDSC